MSSVPDAGRPSLRESLPAGVLDAAFNSLGTFVVGLTATRIFDPALLGVYAVFFTAHLMGVVVPMYLIYLPAEVRAVARERIHRLPILRRSVVLAAGPSLLTALAVLCALFVVRSQATTAELTALGWTTVAATILVPTQAHLRRMLHIAECSWRAMTVSGVQLAGAVAAVIGLLAAGVPDAWVPFGALALATAVSILVGFALTLSGLREAAARLRLTDLTGSGRWLLVTGIVPTGAGFIAAALINQLAGPEELGFAEAARLAAQPILVLGLGLNAVLGPRSMEAAHRRDRRSARRVERVFLVVLAAAVAGYLVVAGGPWPWNPLYHLVPPAYEVVGLAALMILANAAAGSILPLQRELFGARRERKLAAIEMMASAAAIAVATSAGVTGAFARPMHLLAGNGWRAIHYRRTLKPVYARQRAAIPGHRRLLGPD